MITVTTDITTPSIVREDDTIQHIEDTPLFTAIRNNRFVELPWTTLNAELSRLLYSTLAVCISRMVGEVDGCPPPQFEKE